MHFNIVNVSVKYPVVNMGVKKSAQPIKTKQIKAISIINFSLLIFLLIPSIASVLYLKQIIKIIVELT